MVGIPRCWMIWGCTKFPIAPESTKALRLAEKGGEVGSSSCIQAGIKIGLVGDDAESEETFTLQS